MTVAWVGLGANLGDAEAALAQALRDIATLPGTSLLRTSSLYCSAPVDAAGPDFVNAVAEIDTTLAPLPLLHALQAIERAHGRERPYRNAPRTLDLDLLFHGDSVLDTPALALPHPRLHERAFVLVPLLELDPGFAHPALGALADCLARITDQRVTRLLQSPAADSTGLMPP